tara:strand:+ start:44 stop:307 length:264 start_codon:yes stop_codon:yes gene_type:complete
MARFNQVGDNLVPFTSAEETARDAEEAAWLADTDKRNAQALLEKHDAKGYTRAWETSVAPLVAAETLPEYDQAIFDAKKAARAVVEG